MGNRILHWDLRIVCPERSQAVSIVKDLLDADVDFDVNFSYEVAEEGKGKQYVVSIENMAWADNLKTVAEIAQKYDLDI